MQTQDTPLFIVRELDLGDHTLFVFNNRSVQIADLSGECYTADNVTDLTADETYHLYVALREVFREGETSVQRADH